jgi:uncharacterized protein
MPWIFFLAIPVVFFLIFFLHLAVYKGLVAIFALSSSAALLGLKILLIALGGGFVAAMIMASQYNNTFTRIFYTITASWYGFLLYLFLATAIYAIFAKIFGGVAPNITALLGKGLILCSVVVTAYGLWNAEQIVFTRYNVSLPGIPKAWVGKHVVWVSDIHLDQVHGVEYSRRIVSAIENEKPDIVFIGGDLYDGVKIDESAVIAPFKELKPKDGIFFITGNHEEFSDQNKSNYVKAIKQAGIRVLDNEVVNIDGVNIIGVDDNDSVNKKVFEDTLTNLHLNKKTPSILLKHQPSGLDIAEKFGIDMQISGHTHQAQVYPLSYVTKLMYKGYDYGEKKYGSMDVFTSSGLGTWGPPIRVGTKPEILIFDFK